MKLDRNINANGRGKYALLKLRKLDSVDPKLDLDVDAALATLEAAGVVDWGSAPETEFFVIRLKDEYAQAALDAYAEAAVDDDVEYAEEVGNLALRAGPDHPNCKKPD